MDVFIAISFLGGLALFLYGMRVMGQGLEALSGSRMKGLLARLCSTTWRGLLVGAAVTAAVQSSSATTVMVIGFVNSGLMELGQAVGVIMGANLGTTLTSWLLSLTGVSGDSLPLRLLRPASLAALLTFVGVLLMLWRRADGHERRGRVGGILAGLGILFFGMEMMSSAVEPLTELPGFASLLTLFESPPAGLLAGVVMTAIVQSSSAAIGILQALSVGGSVTLSAAIPIVLGQNIGTCVTTLLSGIGASKNARRAALVHLYFNTIGAAAFMLVFYGLNSLLHFEFLSGAVTPFALAAIHTGFNAFAVIVLYPFAGRLTRLAELTVPDDATQGGEAVFSLLDERFLRVPATALEMCRRAWGRMLWLARQSLVAVRQSERPERPEQSKQSERPERPSGDPLERAAANERLINAYEVDLKAYMLRLSAVPLGERSLRELTRLMYAVGDTERIGDHAGSLARAAERLRGESGLSDVAEQELEQLLAALDELLDMTMQASVGEYAADEAEATVPATASDEDSPLRVAAARASARVEAVRRLCEQLRERHLRRLGGGDCSPETAAVFYGMLIDAERIAAHCEALVEPRVDGAELYDGAAPAAARMVRGLRRGQRTKMNYQP